jgi:hypothetical protein
MKAKAKTSPEFDRFNALVGKVLAVPKTVLNQRLKDYEKQKPKRRGPNSKKTTQGSI